MVAYLECQAMSLDTILEEDNPKSITSKFKVNKVSKSMQDRHHLSWMSANVTRHNFG